MGGVITSVAIQGYNQVSKFANVMSPWMILIFFAAAIVGLAQLGVSSAESLLTIAQEVIWKRVPLPGMTQFTIWHIIFFAWFCNIAMHIGMSDLTILRYAKSWSSGFSVFAGV